MKVVMNQEMLELYQNGKSKKYKDVERNNVLLKGFIAAVKLMTLVNTADELKEFSYLHYEKLKYQWSGYSSVRLSNRYVHRLLFTETDEGVEVELIDIDDTHYGNKH